MNKRSILVVMFLAIILGISLQSCKTQLVVKGLEFEAGKATVKSEAVSSLDKIVTSMGTKKFKIQVNGYSDNVGDTALNRKLSEQRAGAVRDYLVTKGVKKERVIIHGYGSSNPIADNSTEAGRKKNRRTEVRVPTLKAGKFKKNGLVTRKSYIVIE